MIYLKYCKKNMPNCKITVNTRAFDTQVHQISFLISVLEQNAQPWRAS
jgi:hypothetical protein